MVGQQTQQRMLQASKTFMDGLPEDQADRRMQNR